MQIKWQTSSYLSPKLVARPRPSKGGCGVFVQKSVQAGEVLSVWSGEIMTLAQVHLLPAHIRPYSVQVEENLCLVTTRPPEPADYINHSCDPNAGLVGQITLIAMRNIAPGEEVCFDYAMSDGSPYDEFECACGATNCRGHVSGNDWALPQLWERYEGYFSPYLQRRIERLRNKQRLPVRVAEID